MNPSFLKLKYRLDKVQKKRRYQIPAFYNIKFSVYSP